MNFATKILRASDAKTDCEIMPNYTTKNIAGSSLRVLVKQAHSQ